MSASTRSAPMSRRCSRPSSAYRFGGRCPRRPIDRDHRRVAGARGIAGQRALSCDGHDRFRLRRRVHRRRVVQVTGGENGLMNVPPLAGWSIGERGIAVAAILMVIALALYKRLAQSGWGLAMRAVRDSETAAGAMGVNPLAIRTLAFTVSAVLAGVAGSFFASAPPSSRRARSRSSSRSCSCWSSSSAAPSAPTGR